MPTRRDTNFQRLRSDEEFENLVLDLCKREWSDPYASDRHGRSGQEQMGVDIYGYPADRNGMIHGAQCKLRTGDKQPTRNEIEEEVKRAKNFKPSLEVLIITTDAPRDANTQELIRTINNREKKSGGFEVTIWFWDSICHRLSTHTDLIIKYFSDYLANITNAPEAEKLVDIPLRMVSFLLDIGIEKTPVEEALELRGVQIIRASNMLEGNSLAPDGFLYQYHDKSSARLMKLAAQVVSKTTPIFIVVSDDFRQQLADLIMGFRGSLEGITMTTTDIEVSLFTQKIFEHVFKHGYYRRGSLATVDLSIRSAATRPKRTFLDINWESRFSNEKFPSLEEWLTLLSPAMVDVQRQVNSLGDNLLIQIRSTLQLPAAFAWGYTFNIRVARLGIWARERGVSDFRQQYWRSDAETGSITLSEKWILPVKINTRSIIIELSNGHDIHAAVETYMNTTNIQPESWVQIGHIKTDGRLSNIDEGCAVAYANRVGEIFRDIRQKGITDFHLFLAMPSSLAILIGQRLQACGRIHLYWFDNPTYQYAFTLK